MKRLKHKAIVLLVVLNLASCGMLNMDPYEPDSVFSKDGYFNISPVKSEYSLGDTLWVYFSVPKYFDDLGACFVNSDTLSIDMDLFWGEITNSDTTLFYIQEKFDLSNMPLRKGKFYFNENIVGYYSCIFSLSDDLYEFEYGVILNETGSFYIGFKSQNWCSLYFKKGNELACEYATHFLSNFKFNNSNGLYFAVVDH